MEIFLPITYLNDFVFCPYSVYLHQVFDNSEEVVYHAEPQQKGKQAHQIIDEPNKQQFSLIKGMYVICKALGVYGKIDTLYVEEKKLVESKYRISTLYRGYYYQIWAQYFALIEEGFSVQTLAFYSISDKKTYPIPIPEQAEFDELKAHIHNIIHFDFEQKIDINPKKCAHCIYASLCDKTNIDHVYA